MSQTPPLSDPESTPCPTCGEPVGPRDKFCSICGANLSRSSQWVAPATTSSATAINEEIAPLPGTPVGTETSRRRRKKKKRQWFKRPMIMIPLIIAVILGSIAGVIAVQTHSALEEVHSISTPPPEVSAANLGGDEDVPIDTGPAQQALNDRATREAQGESSTSTTETAEPTVASSGNTDGTTPPTVAAETNEANSADDRQQPTQTAKASSGGFVVESSTVSEEESTKSTASTSENAGATTPPTVTSETSVTDSTEDSQQTTQATTSSSSNLVSEGTTVPQVAASESASIATDDGTETAAATETGGSNTQGAESTANGEESTAVGPTEIVEVEETAAIVATDNATQSAVVSDPVESDGMTVLLMGVDSRDGEAIDIGVRPDSLAVLHLDPETGSCRILAVPRDSRAELPGYGLSKINHALAVAGIPYEMLVIEEYLGLSLDHYALIDFAGLESVVDNLGGITVENPEEFEMGGQTFEEGTLELNGEQALLYSRFRHDSQGDFGRISRQQQVLRAMMDKASGVNAVSTLPSMFTLLSEHFRTDFGITDLVGLADDYRTSCTSESVETRTIPGDVSMEYDELMQQDLSFVTSDPDQVRADVDWLLGVEPPNVATPQSESTPSLRMVPFTIQHDPQARRSLRGRRCQHLPL